MDLWTVDTVDALKSMIGEKLKKNTLLNTAWTGNLHLAEEG